MKQVIKVLSPGKKIFFASDFHLGVPTAEESLLREKKIVAWLESIRNEAQAIYLLGDLFDFWFEYRHAIPKGFIRLQGKLAELSDTGIPVYIFTGNHDMWIFNYFTDELNIPVFRNPIELTIGDKEFLIGHGDALGPGEKTFKLLRKFFHNPLCQFLFSWIHPDIGIGLANYFSRRSRNKTRKRGEEFLGDKEFLYQYCIEQEAIKHRDYYIFGHRHLKLEMKVGTNSVYMNIGDWINYYTYAEYDGNKLELKEFRN
jgi:UDP-2,3-diacylglucosamine hydrolase